jgi:two-component system chemotaxis response regulator CheB
MTIRILVVDDSVVIRKLLTTTLGEVPGMEVVATAAQGRIALAKIAQLRPDIVILDVEMPEMDGIETVKRIRKESPRLPVIMFSTKTERGAVATIEALTSGASDYVTKPSNAGNVLVAMARVRDELVPKIQALTAGARSAGVPPPTPVSPAPAPATTTAKTTTMPLLSRSSAASAYQSPEVTTRLATIPVRSATQLIPRPRSTTSSPVIPDVVAARPNRAAGPRPPVEIVAIGASTGGPNALAVILPQLPAEFPVPIVIVQHMLATFTRHFAERLSSQCQLEILEAAAGEALVPGHAYVARGDYHLLVERRAGRAYLVLNQDQVENFCRPAVDVLFRSVAHCYGPSALAVVLTGMGHDGLLGCGAIREAGGDVLVQDEPTSVVWGMPGFVAKAGLANQVMPLEHLGGEIRRRVALGVRVVGAMP